MGKEVGDFEKGIADGSEDALRIVSITVRKRLSAQNTL